MTKKTGAKLKTWILSALVATILFGTLFLDSMAWFPSTPSTFDVYTINANGYLYVSASANTSDETFAAVPAVAMPGAIAAGEHYDVLRLYNPLDPEPSYISKVATPSTVTCNVLVNNDKCEIDYVPLRKAFPGWVDCPDCEGACYTKVDDNWVACSTCGGTARVICDVCQGNVRCPDCKETPGKHGSLLCETCEGTGLGVCDVCNGAKYLGVTGSRILCSKCHGLGTATCSCGYQLYPLVQWNMSLEGQDGEIGSDKGKYVYYDWNYETKTFQVGLETTTYTTRNFSTVNKTGAVYDWKAPLGSLTVVDWRVIEAEQNMHQDQLTEQTRENLYDGIPHSAALWSIYPVSVTVRYNMAGSLTMNQDIDWSIITDDETGNTYNYKPADYTPILDDNGDIIWNKLNKYRNCYKPDDWARSYNYVNVDAKNQILVSYRLYFKQTNDMTKDDYYDDKELAIAAVRVYNTRGEARVVTPINGNDYISASFESFQTETYSIEIDYYIAYPDELVDPMLIDGNVYVYIAITARQTE